MNRILIPQSEDFLYWDPEEICRYPQPAGPEDHWFAAPGAEGARCGCAAEEGEP